MLASLAAASDVNLKESCLFSQGNYNNSAFLYQELPLSAVLPTARMALHPEEPAHRLLLGIHSPRPAVHSFPTPKPKAAL